MSPRCPGTDDMGMDTDRTTDRKDRTMDVTTARNEVAIAREALAAAQANLDAATDAAADVARTAADGTVVGRTDASFFATDPKWASRDAIVLPTGEKGRIAELPYADAGDWAYIMSKPERTRPTRAFLSCGDMGDAWNIGNTHTARHDQTGARLGDYTVVGIVIYGRDGQVLRTVGEVPTTMIAVSVFK